MCHRQLAQLREQLESLEDHHAQLIAVDPHEHWSAKYLLKDSGLRTEDVRFPLLLDPSLTVSATYGVAFQMRIHTEWSTRPATFIIDRSGVLRYSKRATSFNDRPSPDDIVSELRKLK